MPLMKDKPESELESWIDRELHALPDLPAPQTLAPRVLAMIRPQPMLSNPRGRLMIKMALLVLLIGSLGWIGFANRGAWAGIPEVSRKWDFWSTTMASIWLTLTTLVNDLFFGLRLLQEQGWTSHPIMGSVISIFLMYIVFVSIGTGYYHLAAKARKTRFHLI